MVKHFFKTPHIFRTSTSIIIYINLFIYIIIDLNRGRKRVCVKNVWPFDHLTIWPYNEMSWCCKQLVISILNDFLGDGLKRTKVQHFFVNAVSHYFFRKIIYVYRWIDKIGNWNINPHKRHCLYVIIKMQEYNERKW